tara:strand:+ start:107 stop:709 length:603 start_codon:yes stop_codon:yes gene_type:complete
MNPIILAVTGASAQQLAERSIQLLLANNKHIYLVLSKGAYEVWKSELNISIPLNPIQQETFWRKRFQIDTGKLTCFKWNDNSAPFASGSFKTTGMVVIPCSMGTIGRIASGVSRDLIERAADVHLKEKRPLIISPRESPFNLIHLKNMTLLSEAGANIVPCIPAWYSNPISIDEMIDFMIVRLFDSMNFDLKKINRWKTS